MKILRVLVIVTLGIAVLASATWFFTHRDEELPPLPGVDSVGTGVQSVQLFFASPAGDSLVSEPRDVVAAGTLHERAAGLIAELERGPDRDGVKVLPEGTTLLHAYLDERGLLIVDLSRAFQQNFRGGTGAEQLAIGSLVRTLGANLPDVRQVLVVCGGAPLTSLGGHLPLDRPLDVSDWP
jgi:spore germination protein GerM